MSLTAVWSGSIEQFLHDAEAGALPQTFKANYSVLQRKLAEPSEASSWDASIEFLPSLLKACAIPCAHLMAELSMPSSAERADFILIGGTKEAPRGIVIEVKQWSNFQYLQGRELVRIADNYDDLHPIL